MEFLFLSINIKMAMQPKSLLPDVISGASGGGGTQSYKIKSLLKT
jgi:hypothetical protein